MNKYCLFITLGLFLGTLFLEGQNLTVTQTFQFIPNSSVLASYKNQFGSWAQGDKFPYAVIRIRLEGNAYEVIAAKQLLHLNIDENTTEIAVYKDMQNELLFLVPTTAKQIYLTCGTGCDQQLIIDSDNPLQTNSVYIGRVHYIPKAVEASTTTTTATIEMRQFFIFRLTPANAVVTVEEEGMNQVWNTQDGIAYKMLKHGDYAYSVSADGYYTQQGFIRVSDETRELTITLLPIQ